MSDQLQAAREQAQHTVKAFSSIIRYHAENGPVTSIGSEEFRACYDAAKLLRDFIDERGVNIWMARELAAAIVRDVGNALGKTDAEGERLTGAVYQSASQLVVKVLAATPPRKKYLF